MAMAMAMEQQQLHIVMFPWFGFGHISPFVQLSNKLSSHGGVRISFISATGNIKRISSSLSLNPTVQIIPLEIPHIEGLPPGLDNTSKITSAMGELLKQALDQLQPQLKKILSTLKPHFVLYDFAQHWIPSLAAPLGIRPILLSVFSAISGAFNTVPSRLEQGGRSPNLEEMKKPPIDFPATSSVKALKAYEARDLLYIFMSFNGAPSVYDRLLAGNSLCSAIIIKSCNEMEAAYIEYMRTQLGKPILVAGPVVPEPPTGLLDERWAKWLAKFPLKSVIFCSFGSETFLSDNQVKELVLGLEQTGLPFFVVLNFPAEEDIKHKLKTTLPEGFEDRIQDKAVVHTGWVQQQHILAHESVGCFVNHSGLSSITEALINDCQLVLLPMKGDQFLNAKLLAGDLNVAVEVIRSDEDGYFGKDDLCTAVETVMVDVDKEPGVSIKENHHKWRKFMLDKNVHEGFINNLVEEMKDMVFTNAH